MIVRLSPDLDNLVTEIVSGKTERVNDGIGQLGDFDATE